MSGEAYVPGQKPTLITIVQLASGAFLWHALAQIPADVAVLRQGKKGRLGSMLLLYLPCRVLSLLSVLFEAVYVVLSPHALGETLGKAALVLRLITLVFACAIYLIRVNTLWRNNVVWTVSVASQLALFGIALFELIQPTHESLFKHSDVAVTSLWIYLATIIFVFSLIGLYGPPRERRMSASTRPRGARTTTRYAENRSPLQSFIREITKEGVFSLAFCWLACVTLASIYMTMNAWDSPTRRLFCYIGWLIFVRTSFLQYNRLGDKQSLFYVPEFSFNHDKSKGKRSENLQLGTSADADSREGTDAATKPTSTVAHNELETQARNGAMTPRPRLGLNVHCGIGAAVCVAGGVAAAPGCGDAGEVELKTFSGERSLSSPGCARTDTMARQEDSPSPTSDARSSPRASSAHTATPSSYPPSTAYPPTASSTTLISPTLGRVSGSGRGSGSESE